MGCREGFIALFVSRCVDAETVTHPCRDPGFVQGDPEFHLVRQCLVEDVCVLREAFARLPARPSAAVFERLRQVPMVKREDRLDGAFSQAIDQAPVMVEPVLIGGSGPLWLNAWPGYGEAVRLHPEVGHQVEVFLQAVVMVAGNVSRVAMANLALGVAERVPDRRSASVLCGGALDLVGGRGRAPQKVLGESHPCTSLSASRIIFSAPVAAPRLRGNPASASN